MQRWLRREERAESLKSYWGRAESEATGLAPTEWEEKGRDLRRGGKKMICPRG